MPWGRIDDTYYDHPKLEELGGIGQWPDRVVAAGLNALAWSWCNRFLTDGRVPRTTVIRLMGPLIEPAAAIALAEQLVTVGLWEKAPNSYAIHDFLHYNDSREQVLARRQREAARKAAYRSGKRPSGSPSGTASVDDPAVPPVVPTGHDVPAGQMSHGLSHGVSRAESRRVSRDSSRARIPTRPDPTRPIDKVPPLERGSRENGAEPTLSKTELEKWSTFGREWSAFKAAWIGRGFRLPPVGSALDDDSSQRGMLYQILDARPTDLERWVGEAPGKTPHDVVGWILGQWRDVRVEAGLDEDAPDPGVITRSEAPVALAGILNRLMGDES